MVNPHGVVDGMRLTLDRAELMTDGAIRCRLLFTRLLWLPFALPDDTPRTHRLAAPVWV